MEPGFTKIFESLLDSTVWQESKETRLVWITMLLMKNRNHVVEASVPGLAKRAGVSVGECEEALERFKAPDAYSRTKDNDGRRIEDVEGGWKVLNGERYRQRMGPEERKEYQAAWMREYRKRRKEVKMEGAKFGAQQAIKEGLVERHAESHVEGGGPG